MKQAELMVELVADLIEFYEAEVLPDGLIYLELEMYGFGVLVVEEKSKHRLMSVDYWLYDAQGHPVPEPEVLFFVDEGGHWIPFELRRHTTGHQVYATLNENATELTVTDEAGQAALAGFADTWAQALRAHGWIGKAEKTITQPRPWPDVDDPHVHPAMIDELWELVALYGQCKATDGCWVAPNGVCEHGCQSLLVEMGEVDLDRLTTAVGRDDI